MDGRLLDWDNATIHVLTHTLHYGLGVFEGIRCYQTKKGPAIFRLDDHVERLFNSSHIFLVDIPYSKKDICDAIVKTVRINKLKECYIRPLVFIGYGAMGLEGYYGASDDQNALAVIGYALDAGCTFIDTADAYGNGHNEQLVGQAVLSSPLTFPVLQSPQASAEKYSGIRLTL